MHTKITKTSQAEAAASRAIGQIRQGLDLGDATDAVALSERLAARLAGLAADDRRLLRRDMAVAAHDLEALVEALENELGLLAADLKALNHRTGAARAYGQAATIIPLRRA